MRFCTDPNPLPCQCRLNFFAIVICTAHSHTCKLYNIYFYLLARQWLALHIISEGAGSAIFATEWDRHRNDDGFYQRFRFHGSSGFFYLSLPQPFFLMTASHIRPSFELFIWELNNVTLVFWWLLLALSQGPTLVTSRNFDDFWSATCCKFRISSLSPFMNLGSQSYRQSFTAWTTETYRPIHILSSEEIKLWI